MRQRLAGMFFSLIFINFFSVVFQSVSPKLIKRLLDKSSKESDPGIIEKYRTELEGVLDNDTLVDEANVDETTQDIKDEEAEDPLKCVSEMMPDNLEASSSIAKLLETLDKYPDKRFLIFSSWYERHRWCFCFQFNVL